jgi:cytochrome c-type biogenesis protein CcmF
MLGIVASSSFSTPLPQIGQIQRQGDSEKKQTRENFVVAKGETRMINGYRVTYTGKEPNARGRNQYLLDVTDPYGRSFTMKPVAYQSESSGQWILNPDVKAFVEQDLYTAVTPRAATGVDDRETPGGEIRLSRGDSTVIGNDRFAIAFKQFDMDIDPSRLPPNTDVSVGAVLEVTNLKTQETRTLKPIYIVKDNRSEQYIENRVADWGLRMAFTQMDASNGEISLAIEGVDVMPEDWVVVQAYEKPFISLLWIGIIVLTVGFCVSIVRRAQDVRFSAQRETPAA